MRKAFVCGLLLASLPALAGVYRWTDDKGVVHYSDNPPSPDAKPTELPKLQTFDSKSLTKGEPVNGGPDAADEPPTDSGPATPAAKPVITSPEDQATIRDTSGQITVTISPAGGVAFVYYLDGSAQNKEPTPSSSYLLDNVERGSHTIEVAAIDPNGKEVSRSNKVTIYYMPPRVNMVPSKKPPPKIGKG